MMESSFAPGHEFAGRYRVSELLGVGHTVEAYLAYDLVLQRSVVLKVLLANLAAHEEVRRAFRDHIIQAAAFRHPHVARVFDGGQQSGSIFMVGEYLGGGSLEDILRSGTVLSVEDTARLGRDVASALAYIHQNNLIHGELSPSKLLFDESGHVRISDVALTGLSGPHRNFASRDDVRYFSPEQARGDVAGAASDVYALALILFESVTGSAPFEGQSAEAMLHERLRAPLPSRPELAGLDILLAQASVSDPAARLGADELAQRLSAVVPDDSPFVKRDGPAPSLLGSFALAEPRQSVGFRKPSPHQIVSASRPSSSFSQPGTARPSAPPRRLVPGSFDDLTPTRGARRPMYLAAAIVLLLVALGGGVAWKLGYLSTKHTAPNVYGLSLSQASALVKSDGLTLNVTTHTSSPTVKAGDILSQTPAAGASVAGGAALSVTLSSGPATAPVAVPVSLIAMTCAAAQSTLSALHVNASCPSSATLPSNTVARGLVAGWMFNSTKNPGAVPRGSTLILETSSGPATVATTTSTTPTTSPPIVTTTTAPTSTAAPTTSSTTSTTTTAPAKTVLMPNLVGMTRTQANAALTQLGLFYSTQGPGAHTTKWTHVVSTIPVAGTSVPYKSTVTLNVAE